MGIKEFLSRKDQCRPTNVVNLFSSEEAQCTLHKHVERSQGRFHLVVHPFMNDGAVNQPRDYRNFTMQRGDAFDNMLQSGVPVVVFEEADRIAMLPRNIGSNYGETVFVIPTYRSTPLPFAGVDPSLHDQEINDRFPYIFERESWEKATGMLWRLGGRMVIVSGQLLYVYRQDGEEIHLGRCVGATATVLHLSGFDVTLGTTVYPMKLQHDIPFGSLQRVVFDDFPILDTFPFPLRSAA